MCWQELKAPYCTYVACSLQLDTTVFLFLMLSSEQLKSSLDFFIINKA